MLLSFPFLFPGAEAYMRAGLRPQLLEPVIQTTRF